MHQENASPPSDASLSLKRKADDSIPYTPEEQQHVLKKLRLHHTNPDGTLTLQSANHTQVKLRPLPTPHVGSHDCSIKTRQRRSKIQEQLLQQLSTPSTVTSPTERTLHQQAQLTSLIKRNKETVTTCAEAAGIKVLHRLSVDDMLQLEKLTFLPNNTFRLIRSFLNHHKLPILPSESQMRKRMAEMIHELQVGTAPLMIDGKEETITYARAKDVTDVVQHHVQLLSDNKLLVQHHNFPPNTLLLQTQSDKGGDSTKLCIQSLNRHDVNSVHHLIPVAMYEGKSWMRDQQMDVIDGINAQIFSFHLCIHICDYIIYVYICRCW
jgi:hypothetical protein